MNSSHASALAATMQRYNNLGMLRDPTRAALFEFMPPELHIKIWKDAFAEWSKTQRRVRIVVPASPLVSDKVICDQINNLSFPHPNSLSDGSGFSSKVCPLLSASFEARQIALEQFSGSLDICTCYQDQCYQCQDLGWELEYYGAQVCDCKKWCEEKCRVKAYFTTEQIFYIPGFATISRQIGRLLSDDVERRIFDIHPLAWASKLQNVVLEAHHLSGQAGESIKATLSKFTSLKKLYIVWRFDPRDGIDQSFITQYASEDNDNKKVLTPETQLHCVEQAFFESPELWLNQLTGVVTEFIFVPVDLSGGDHLGCEKVNKCVQALEDYFTPGNHTRKTRAKNLKRIREDITYEFNLLRERRREEEQSLEQKENAAIFAEQEIAEFLSRLSELERVEFSSQHGEVEIDKLELWMLRLQRLTRTFKEMVRLHQNRETLRTLTMQKTFL